MEILTHTQTQTQTQIDGTIRENTNIGVYSLHSTHTKHKHACLSMEILEKILSRGLQFHSTYTHTKPNTNTNQWNY